MSDWECHRVLRNVFHGKHSQQIGREEARIHVITRAVGEYNSVCLIYLKVSQLSDGGYLTG